MARERKKRDPRAVPPKLGRLVYVLAEPLTDGTWYLSGCHTMREARVVMASFDDGTLLYKCRVEKAYVQRKGKPDAR